MADVAGLLLTGGAGKRMGGPKADLVVGGERLADRTARVLRGVCEPVFEVGPGYTDLEAAPEDEPGRGPLAAIAAGGAALRGRGHDGPALVLAVDLPLVTEEALRFLRDFPGDGSVVPFLEGEPQPMCARYSAEALERAGVLVSGGERMVRTLLREGEVQWAGPRMWGHLASPSAFKDVDTPQDLAELGLDAAGGVEQ